MTVTYETDTTDPCMEEALLLLLEIYGWRPVWTNNKVTERILRFEKKDK